MSVPAYERYRDSGVEWLGKVPRHWTLAPLKRDLTFLTSGSRGWADHYAEAAIALLQERRNALISAAVTGKIDVRGFAPSVKEDAYAA